MKCYKAKWILTSTGEVLEDKAIVVDEGKIIGIIPHSEVNFEAKYVKELGNCVITPGFINLFEQLQYTNVGQVKPKSFKNKFKSFYMNVIKKYTFAGVKSHNYSLKWANILSEYFCMDRSDKIQSFKDGLEQSIKAGTTCIAQVSKEQKYFEIINKAPIKTYLFFEVWADSNEKSKQQFKRLRDWVEKLVFNKSEDTYIGIGLNSISGVHKKLWELFSKYCRKHNMLIMTRFAESSDEMEWLEYGFSDIDLLHKFMGFRKISPYQKELSPVEYLDKLKVLTKKVIVANANYLSDKELQKLADTGVKFVYQPEYSEQICNQKQEFETVLKDFGKDFGFSTQSFGKDQHFSLLKVAAESDKGKQLDIIELIKYLTVYPARILRLDNKIGTIEVGKDADFNVFRLDDNEDYQSLMHKTIPNAVYARGRKLIKDDEVRFTL